MPLDFDIITGLNTTNSDILKQDTQIRLANLLSTKPNLNTGGVIMPSAPGSAGLPVGSNPNTLPLQDKGKIATEAWLSKAKRMDTGFMTGSGQENIVDAAPARRYLDEQFGYNPNRDNEDFYAKRQHWYSEIPKAVALRFPSLVLTKTGTGIGYLAGLINPLNWGDNYIANASDNVMARAFENLEDSIKNDWLPAFQETADVNKGFFNRAFTDLNFWTDDVADASAFIASAFVPGLAISKIGVGARAASMLSKLGIAAENGVLGNLGLSKLGSYMRNAQVIASGLDKTLITAVNTASEAMWEAKGVRDNLIDSLQTQINPETNRNYTEPEARNKAADYARNTFLMNAAALSVSNLWEANLLYKALGKAPAEAAGIANNAIGKAFEASKATSRLGKFSESVPGTIAKEALKGLGIEGLYEENVQLAIQRTNERSGKYSSFLTQLVGQTRDAITGEDPEASISIGLGGLIGGLSSVVVGRSYKDVAKQQAANQLAINKLTEAQTNWLSFGDIYKKDDNGNRIYDKGNPVLDLSKVNGVVNQWKIMADLQQDISTTKDENLLPILKKEAFARYVKAHINGGIEDSLDQKLDGLLSMSDETLTQLGFNPSNPNKVGEVAELKAYAKDLIDLNRSIERDILDRPNSGEDLAAFQLRKQALYTHGARQLALERQSGRLSSQIEDIRSRMSSPSLSDTLVDQLNYLNDRIKAQQNLVDALDNYSIDGTEVDRSKEEKELVSLKNQLARAENEAKNLSVPLKKEGDRYQYENPERANNILNKSLQNKIKQKAEIDNAAKTANNEFYSIADINTGSKYFNDKLNKELDDSTEGISTDNETPVINPSEETPTGKAVQIVMKDNNGADRQVTLEEGRVYMGPLSTSKVAFNKNVKATVFKNDKIKVIKINDDGTVVLTINDDAPVTFSQDELSSLTAFKAYNDLTPTQKFYILNRNKVIPYRIPTTYNKQTKSWDTKVVNGRLSYNKQDNLLELVYDKDKRTPFRRKYMVGTPIDLTTLPQDVQTALQDNELVLEKHRQAQTKLFEDLINDTDNQIEQQKRRSLDNEDRLAKTQLRLEKLTNDLENAREQLSKEDPKKVIDARTRAAKLSRLVKSLESEIGETELLIQSLEQEKSDTIKRQAALKYLMDEYLVAYDRLIDTNEPYNRNELQEGEAYQKNLELAEGNTSRFTTAQIEAMLDDSNTELEVLDNKIKTLTDYLNRLKRILDVNKFELSLLDLLSQFGDNIETIKDRLRDTISKSGVPSDRELAQKLLSTVSRREDSLKSVGNLLRLITNTENSLKEAQDEFKAAQEKNLRLVNAFNLRSEINSVKERVSFLKDVFAGLARTFERQKAASYFAQQGNRVKARTVEDAVSLKEQEQLLSDFIVEPPVDSEIDSEEKVIFGDTFKPIMTADNNPMYKSADSHYPNDSLNTNAYAQRFFKFTSQLDIASAVSSGTPYYIQPITEANDGIYGANIRYTSDPTTYPDDIKFVITKLDTDGNYKPVDIHGNILTNPDSSNIVYSSFYGHRDLLSPDNKTKLEWLRKNFAIKESLTDEQLLSKADEFIKFRDWVKDQVKSKGNIYLPLTSKSNGIQNREPKDANNRPQQLSVEGRLTSDNPNWDDVQLLVSTTNGEIAGSTTVRIKPGRTVIRRNGAIVQVYNRLLNTEEKDRIRRLLLKLTETMGNSNTIDQTRLITRYLSSIIYWRAASDTTAKNQFYIDKGYLYKGDMSIPFTRESIEQNIEGLLEGVYHQVANKLVNDNRQYQVLDIGSNNEITYKTYKSYKEYLLTSKNRKTGEYPVFTNIVSNQPDNVTNPQLINVYINFSVPSESVPNTVTGNATTVQANTPAPQSKYTVTDIDSDLSKKAEGNYVMKYENTSSGVTLVVSLYKNGERFGVTNVITQKGEPKNPRKTADTVADWLTNLNTVAYEGNITGLQAIQAAKEKGIVLNLAKVTTPIVNAPEDTMNPKLEALVTPPASIIAPAESTPKPADTSSTAPVSTFTEVPKSPSAQDILNQMREQESDDSGFDYRIVLRDDNYVRENTDNIKSFFKSNLPQFDLKFVDNLIHGKAWGAYKDGAVYIYNNAEIGTGFHEAFGAVWGAILSPEEQHGLINEFKKRDDYKSQLAKVAQAYKGANEDQLIREQLSEEFREYMLTNGSNVIKGQGRRNSFFVRLFRAIRNLVEWLLSPLGRIEAPDVDRLFKKISSGGYSQAPIRDYSKIYVDFRRFPGVSQEVITDAIDGITAMFFGRLFRDNNTESLFSKDGNNAELVNSIWNDIQREVDRKWKQEALRVAAVELGYITLSDDLSKVNNLEADKLQILTNKLNEYRDINTINYRDKLLILNNFNGRVFNVFADYLKTFGFVLKRKGANSEIDADDLVTEEKESVVVDPLGIRDSLTIDTRNTANTTVKLLVASLSDDRYNTKGLPEPLRNSMGLPRLVDYDKTLSLLFNELEGIVGVYKDGSWTSRITQMFDTLDSKFREGSGRYKQGYLWIGKLKSRLKYTNLNGDPISTSTLTEDDMRLRVGFIKSFSKAKNTPIKLIFGENGEIYEVDPISTSNRLRIRERWANQSKASYQSGSPFLHIENNEIRFNKNNDKFKSLLNSNKLEDRLSLLKNIGISFSGSEIEITQGKFATKFGDAFNSIKLKINDGTINTFDDLFSKQVVNGPINALLSIEEASTSDNLSLQYRNPEGENEYSIVLPSNIANTLNSLAGINNIADFVRTNPQYGTVDNNNVVTLNVYQQGSQLLKLGGYLFDENGKKRSDISYELISGVAQSTGSDGNKTSQLKRPDKVVQEIYHLLNGRYYTIINSDKSSEFALNLGQFITPFDIVSNPDLRYNAKIMDIYTAHLKDEVDSLIELSKGIGNNIQYYSDNQGKPGEWKLTHFRNIITSPKNNTKLQTAIETDDSLAFVSDPEVHAEIAEYLSKFIRRQQEALINIGIVIPNGDGTFTTNSLSGEQVTKLYEGGMEINPNNFNQAQFDNLTKLLFINHQIAVREQHKLIYGHPALYKDLPKRANGATSTKEAVIDDPEIIQWMDEKMKRADGKIRSAETIQKFNNISYADVNVLSLYYKDIAEGLYKSVSKSLDHSQAEIKVGGRFENGKLVSLILDGNKPTGDIAAYINLNEADAQAYIMPDFYRDLLYLSAKWSNKQNKQWEYELAYERQKRSNPNHKFYRPYTSDETKNNLPSKDAELVKNGAPQAILPTLKPQYFGYQDSTSLMHTTFLKHSVKPLFYRFVEGTNMEEKYIQSQSNQIDIIGYESGEKVGNVFNEDHKFVPQYSNDGILSSILPPIQKLITRFYGLQVEMAAKIKDTVVRGTQMTKIIMSNVFSGGKAVKNEYAKTIDEYNNILVEITRLGKEQLLREIGLTRESDGTYSTTNLNKLVSTLRDEAIQRDLPYNIVEAFEASLDSDTGLVYKFDSFSNRDKIDNILNAIVDSRVISQKMHGKSSVQVASTLSEKLGSGRSILYRDKNNIYQQTNDFNSLSDAEKKTVRIASSDLKFYRLENNRVQAMEVYIPHYFKELYGDNITTGEIADPRLLRAIGFRIPTQGMNSIDSIVIKGFLTPEEGDIVVVPSELVGKSGSDFDIDKLNLYLPNYYLDIPTRVYSTPEFKEFMQSDLVARGLSKEDANKVMDAYTASDFATINKATYTIKGKLQKGAAISLEEITSGDEYEQTAFIKQSVTNYNSTFKPEGRPKYVEYIPGDNNNIGALQNRLMELMMEILSWPENYRQLVIPNSAETLKGLEEQILALKGQSKDKIIPFTQLSEWDFMNTTRERFLIGKQLVGIGAVNITNHVLTQIANIQLNEIYQEKPINVRFNYNGLNFSSIINTDGQWISELLSEALTGFVDAAKDPFVFELNINPATAGTWFYLLRLGVSVSDIAYFHTQPILSNYLSNQSTNESLLNKVNGNELSKRFVVAKTMSEYVTKAFPGIVKDANGRPSTLSVLVDDTINAAPKEQRRKRAAFKKAMDAVNEKISKIGLEKYSDNALRSNIRDFYADSTYGSVDKLSKEQAQQQLLVLSDWLDYQQQAGAMTTFINGMAYDTQRTKNVIENFVQSFNYNKIKQDKFVSNPEDILSTTFIGEMKDQKDDIPNMFANYFVALHPNARPALLKMFEFLNNPKLSFTDDTKKEYLNRYQNFLLTYVLQNIRTVSEVSGKGHQLNNYYHLFFGDKSFARQLQALKNRPEYKDNKLVKELFPIVSTNRSNPDNVRLFVNKMSTYEIDSIIEAASDLYEKAGIDSSIKEFVSNLAIFSILQSGVQLSPITYTRILPNEMYSRLVNTIFDKFTGGAIDTIDPNVVYKQFFQNNYNNKSLVPDAKSVRQQSDGILSIPNTYNISNYDYVTKTFERKNPINGNSYTKAEKDSLVKQKKWDELYEKVLFGKFMSDDEHTHFSPINKLGNRIFATETYNTDTSSMSQNQLAFTVVNGYVNEGSYRGIQANYDQSVVIEKAPTPLPKITAELLNKYPRFFYDVPLNSDPEEVDNIVENGTITPTRITMDNYKKALELDEKFESMIYDANNNIANLQFPDDEVSGALDNLDNCKK